PKISAPGGMAGFASRLWEAIPAGVRLPSVWADDGEIAFEWKWGERHAILSIEEDGTVGYAIYRGGQFSPGRERANLEVLPADLLDYLRET
ncbi:hypothetical protein, partial [Mesorhizobium sp. M7A.F.Ca.CA.004.11.2.1]|uniref:hypothetical protein n=1 Tax=Mesorhizobium sp. M7A.F.Ca.CA.004.11.2.1 TaxID=2496699 RepID=UPI0019CF655E